MGRPRAFVSKLEEYLEARREDGLRSRTLNEYRRVNLLVFRLLEDAGMEVHPTRIGVREVNYLKTQFPPRGTNFRNQEYHIETFLVFLRWAGNPEMKRYRFRKVRGTRINADWLNEEAMEVIRASVAPDPELSMIFHLEGDLALRRVEVHRLTVESFDGEIVHVQGKGAGEGKARDLRKHPETDHYLADYLEFRRAVARRAMQELGPSVHIPDGLMLYYHPHAKRLGVLGISALDLRLKAMQRASGLKFGHHTLRRTCAREWWKAGASTETISNMLGHEDLKTTIQYLGIKADDHEDVYRMRRERQLQLRAFENTKTLISEKLHQDRITG